jgi:hypothetical protein
MCTSPRSWLLRSRGWQAALAAAALAGWSSLARAGQVEASLEAGVVATSRNDVRIPGSTGSPLSLSDELSSPASPAFRLRVGYRLAERHLISALYAPLQLEARGSVGRELTFAGQSFPAGSSLYAVYRFDSYRLTYRYSFVRAEAWELAAGVTGKIRDAEVSLYGPQVARKTNTGFVPLLNVHAEWRPGGGRWGVLLDADALAAPQGRAEDVLLAATWQARPGLALRLGYRMLEGGADNDEVYSFAWLHYAVAGVELAL